MLLGFLLLYVLLLFVFFKRNTDNYRPFTILAYTVLIYVFSIYLFNELFSFGNLISTYTILGFWILFDAVIGYFIYKFIKEKNVYNKLTNLLKKNYSKNKIYFIIFIILSLLLIGMAISIVPYNYDSLSYHLTRIALWFENGSIAHFATLDTRMLGTPPLKEFVDLHIYGLLGRYNDNLLNLTQTFSYILNILFVLEIADRIGCKKKGKITAVSIFASTAIVLAEAFSTQTDEFATLFVLIFVILVLDIVKNQKFIKIGKEEILNMNFLGLSIAFAYLAKPSGLFAIVIFTLYLMINAISKKAKFSIFIRWLLITGLFTALFAGFELLRNIVTYGSVLDPWQGPGQLVQTFDVRYLFVNMLKNIGTNIKHPLLSSLIRMYDNGVYVVARILHIDVGNALISESVGAEYNLVPESNYSYDCSVNVLFFILLFISLFISLIRFIKTKKFKFNYKFFSIIALIVALCFVKWEIAMVRYLVAYFAVASPAIALQFEEVSSKNDKLHLDVIAVVFCIMMFGSVIDYHSNTMYYPSRFKERNEAYYVLNQAEYKNIYTKLKKELKDVHVNKIGFDMYSSGQYAYPIVRLLDEHSDDVQTINVKNKTSKYENREFRPDMIVLTCYIGYNRCPKDVDTYEYNDVKYTSIKKLSKALWIIRP